MEKLEKTLEVDLRDYIKTELTNGYSIEAIQRALEKKHHKNLIDDAIKQLNHQDFKPRLPKKKSKILSRRLFDEITESLIDYVQEQQMRGYTIDDIKMAMLNYGHAQETIDGAIDFVVHGKQPVFQGADFKLIGLGVGFMIFIFWLSYMVNEPFTRLLIIFFAPVITLFTASFARVKIPLHFLIPAFLIAIFILIAKYTAFGVYQGIEVENIAVLSTLISYLFVVSMVDFHQANLPSVEPASKEEHEKPSEDESELEPIVGADHIDEGRFEKVERLRPIKLERKIEHHHHKKH
ncbi:hypothetical protein GOV04_05540 [Candidatus Woesearchaeota archaeon]|nr:hypothetical protein [Candidatus Woesearchaeota archaeon]